MKNNNPEQIPTSERLARALEAEDDPRLAEMIKKARAYWYDDFKSELVAPCIQLVCDLKALGKYELAERAAGGEFDGTPEESAAWYREEGEQSLMQSILGKKDDDIK